MQLEPDLRYQEKGGYTALHSAAYKGNIEIMHLLLDHAKASGNVEEYLNLKTSKGATVLDIAIKGKHKAMVQLLSQAYKAPVGIESQGNLNQLMEEITNYDQKNS